MTSHINTVYESPFSLAGLKNDTPVLLAFSGGADSSALLHILAEDAKSNGFKLSVAHFHHGIRGEEADRDAEFCKSEAKKYGIDFYLGAADIPSLAKENGTSLEAEARAQRYAFLEKIMRENNIPILVTAHHADDLIESVLMHIIRGSGITGLKGIVPCRSFADDLFIVRPILNASKQDILDYCEANKIEFVNDSTNSDKSYLRNHIRSEVTPKLYELQPSLPEMFSRLSQSATEADSFIDSVAQRFIERECKGSIHVDSLLSLHRALRARVVSLYFEQVCKTTLERVHIDSIIRLCMRGVPHSSVSLPDNNMARIEENRLIFEQDHLDNESEPFFLPFYEGIHTLKNGIIIQIEKNPTGKADSSYESIDIACDAIATGAYFRSKEDGDVILTNKLHKKVKKLFNEKGVRLFLRKSLPILVSFDEILWIPTVAACDSIKTGKIKDGEDFFRITVIFENN